MEALTAVQIAPLMIYDTRKASGSGDVHDTRSQEQRRHGSSRAFGSFGPCIAPTKIFQIDSQAWPPSDNFAFLTRRARLTQIDTCNQDRDFSRGEPQCWEALAILGTLAGLPIASDKPLNERR